MLFSLELTFQPIHVLRGDVSCAAVVPLPLCIQRVQFYALFRVCRHIGTVVVIITGGGGDFCRFVRVKVCGRRCLLGLRVTAVSAAVTRRLLDGMRLLFPGTDAGVVRVVLRVMVPVPDRLSLSLLHPRRRGCGRCHHLQRHRTDGTGCAARGSGRRYVELVGDNLWLKDVVRG